MVKGKAWQIIPRKALFVSYNPSRFCSTASALVPSHKQIAELILEQSSSSQALQTFEWASNIPNFTHSLSTYCALIHKLCTFRQFSIVSQLLDEIPKTTGLSVNDDIFITVVRGYGRARMFKEAIMVLDLVPKLGKGRIMEAIEVLERAEEKGGVLDVVAHNTLLKGFVKAGKVEAAHGFLRQMEMKGCLPNTETYNILIKGFCEFGKLSSAHDLFHEMKRVGLPCSLVTFETLIHGFCSSGRTRDGFKIFELMIEDKHVCGINIGPYNSILYGLYRENCSYQALEFLNYMRNSFPRAVGRSWRILQLCEESRIQEAKQVLDKMHEEGSIPSALVYANSIQGFCKKGFMKDAIQLMNEMIGHGYFPVASTINAVLLEFLQQGRVEAAARLMEDLLRRDRLLDLERCVAIINEMCSDVHLQLVLVDQMVGRGITPNYYIWNAVSLSTLEVTNLSHEHELLIQELIEN